MKSDSDQVPLGNAGETLAETFLKGCSSFRFAIAWV
jgi:hypothetical protein